MSICVLFWGVVTLFVFACYSDIFCFFFPCCFSIQHWRWGATSQVGLPWQPFGTDQSEIQKGIETSTTLRSLQVHQQICCWAWCYHVLSCFITFYFMFYYGPRLDVDDISILWLFIPVSFFGWWEHEANCFVFQQSKAQLLSDIILPRRRFPVLGLVKELEKPNMSAWSSTNLSMATIHLRSGGDGVSLRLPMKSHSHRL